MAELFELSEPMVKSEDMDYCAGKRNVYLQPDKHNEETIHPTIEEQLCILNFKLDNAIEQNDYLKSRFEILENTVGDKFDIVKERGDHITEELNNWKVDGKGDEEDLHCKTYLQKFADSSTLHGVQRIAETGRIRTKVFWVSLMLAAIGYAAWQCVLLLTEYYKYPVFNDVRFHVGSLEWSQITFCNGIPYQRSKIFRHKAFQHMNENSSFRALERIIYNLTEEERISLSWDASELIQAQCFTKGKVNESAVLTLHHTLTRGNCYVLNPPIDTDVVIMNVNIPLNGETIHHHQIKFASVALNQRGIYPTAQPRHTFPIDKPNTEFYFGLEIEKKTNRLNGRYGNCQDDEEKFQARTGLVYTKISCQGECRIKRSMLKCGCVGAYAVYQERYSIVDLYNTRVCPRDKLRCATGEYLRPLHETDCTCKPKCRTTTFSVKTSESVIFDHSHVPFHYICKYVFNASCNHSDEKQWVLSHYARIVLKFEAKTYKEFTEKPLYPLPRLISDIGGTLVICLGASALTMFELVMLFVGLFPIVIRRPRALLY